MRFLTLMTTAILLFVQSASVLGQAQEVSEAGIKGSFTKYIGSAWSARRDLMTSSAWNDYVGDMLYAYKTPANTLLAEYEIENYQFPEWPAGYETLPTKDAVEAASKVREKLVTDLSTKLGEKFGEFLDRLDAKTAQGTLSIRLDDVSVLAKQSNATAECNFTGCSVSIPMRFKLVDGTWKFDGKNEVLFYDRQRKTNE